MKLLAHILSIAALVLSVAWFYTQPGYEPAITFVLGVAGIIGSRFIKSNPSKNSELNNALLRPHRLEARNVLLAFVDFCLSYQTLHPQNSLNRTHDLATEIERFKTKLDSLGPLAVPELNKLRLDIVAKAWNLQRLLDRQQDSDPRPISQEYDSFEDNLDAIVDWFSGVKNIIKAEIDPYLEI
ncbi:MAG: hypothetical protein ABFD81_08755 [Syntrophaceae bacterium]